MKNKILALLCIFLMFTMPVVQGLTITNLEINPDTNQAQVTFETDEQATATISFGEGALDNTVNSPAGTDHSVTLTGLNPATSYQLQVDATSSGDSTTQSDSFTTLTNAIPDKTNGLQAESITSSFVSLKWTLVSNTATYNIYRDNTKIGDTSELTFEDASVVPGQAHMYQVSAQNGAGEGTRSDPLFVTPPEPDTSVPVVSQIVVTPQSGTASITWLTNEAATSRVDFGPTVAFGSVTEDAGLVTTHSATLTGLTDGQEAFFKITACDAENNCGESDVQSFTAGADTQAPSFLVEIPELVSTPFIDVSGTAEAGARMQIFVQGNLKGTITAVPSSGEFTFTNIGLQTSSPENTVRITATDGAGNTEEKTGIVRIDVTPPDLDVSDLSGNVRNGQVIVNGTVNEDVQLFITIRDLESEDQDVSPTTRVDISLPDGQDTVGFNEIIPLSDGRSRILVEAVDIAGNRAREEFTVNADNSAPDILSINLGALSPSYLCQETIRGTVSEAATVEVYLQGSDTPIASVQTSGEDNSFAIPVTLSRDSSLEVTVGDNSPNSQDTLLTFQQDGPSWENRVRVVVRDEVGNEEVAEDVITCALCGFGTDWVPNNAGEAFRPMPNEITPQLLMEGFGQIGMVYDLQWQGLGEPQTIHQIIVEIPPLSDEAQERYDEEFIKRPILTHPSANNPAQGYIQVDLRRQTGIDGAQTENNTDPRYYERELAIAKNREGECGFPGRGCVRLPLMMTIEYGGGSDTFTGGVQKICMDADIDIAQPAFDPEVIPEDLLNGSIQAIDAALGTINTTLSLIQPVTRFATIGCFGTMGVDFLSRFSEASSCAGVDTKSCECEGDTCNGGDECQSCYEAKKTTRTVENTRNLICDRIFCPSVPTYEKYVEDNTNNIDSYCNGLAPKLDDYEIESSDCENLGLAAFDSLEGDAARPCCMKEYEDHWGPGVVLQDVKDMSQCIAWKNAGYDKGENAEKYEQKCGGLGEAFNWVADFSICGDQGSQFTFDTNRPQGFPTQEPVTFVIDKQNKEAWISSLGRTGDLGNDGSLSNVREEISTSRPSDESKIIRPDDICADSDEAKEKRKGVTNRVSGYLCEGYGDQKFVAKPESGILRSIQTICLSAITAYLQHYQQILELVKACFQTILLTGEGSAGVCQALLSNYVCDIIYDLIRCVQTPSDEGEGFRFGGDGISGIFKMANYATGSLKKSVAERYGETNLYDVMFTQKKFIHTICTAAFTGDWNIDWDAIVQQAVEIPIKSTVSLGPANRRFLSFDPTTGRTTHIYELGLVIVAGADINYKVDLVCSSDFSCPNSGNDGAACDCLGAEEKTLDVTSRFGINQLFIGDTLNEAPLIEVNARNIDQSRVRYDKARVTYTFRNNNGEQVQEVTEAKIGIAGGEAHSSCRFDISAGYICQIFTDEDGVAFFERPPSPVYPNSAVQGGNFFSTGQRLVLDAAITVLPGTSIDGSPSDSRKFAHIKVFNQNGVMIKDSHYPLSEATSDARRFIPDFILKQEHFESTRGARTSCRGIEVDGRSTISVNNAAYTGTDARNVVLKVQGDDVVACVARDNLDLGTTENPKSSVDPQDPGLCSNFGADVKNGNKIVVDSTLQADLASSSLTDGAMLVLACSPSQTQQTGTCPTTPQQWKVEMALVNGLTPDGSAFGISEVSRTPEFHQGQPQKHEISVNALCQQEGQLLACSSDGTTPSNDACLCLSGDRSDTCGAGSVCCPAGTVVNGLEHSGCQSQLDCQGNPIVLQPEVSQPQQPTGAVNFDNLVCNPLEPGVNLNTAQKNALFGTMGFNGDIVDPSNDPVGDQLVDLDFMNLDFPVIVDERGVKIRGTHKKIYGAYKCVEREIKATCSAADAAYQIRGPEAGTNTRRSKDSIPGDELSFHMHGIAIDINPDTNPDCRASTITALQETVNDGVSSSQAKQRAQAKLNRCNSAQPYDLPLCWVDAFQKYGFRWLGDAPKGTNTLDYMHFAYRGSNGVRPEWDYDAVMAVAQSVPSGPSDAPTLLAPVRPEDIRLDDMSVQHSNPPYLYGQNRESGIHNAMDIVAKVGRPVYAVASGTVRFASTTEHATAGFHVDLVHDDQLEGKKATTRYLHLQSAAHVFVSTGDTVQAGDLLGCSGSTGRSSGPHLHHELMLGAGVFGDGVDDRVNPAQYYLDSQAVTMGRANEFYKSGARCSEGFDSP